MEDQRARKNRKASQLNKGNVVIAVTAIAAEYTERPKKKLTAKGNVIF